MRLLVTGAWNCTQEQLNKLTEMGHSVTFMQNEADELPVDYSQIDGIICNGLFLHHSVEKFTSLSFVQLTSAGYDRVDTAYINSKGIKLFNASGVYSIPMAEYALCGVLQLLKGADFFAKNGKLHQWVKNRSSVELFGKNVCIIGCGNVGTECAKRFDAMGCKVYGVDLFPVQKGCYQRIFPLNELKKVLGMANVVILTLPLTEDSYHIIDADALECMNKNSILVNIARGGVVDTNALVRVLNEHCLGGAVLDVFEEEPLGSNSPLWDMENVIITPHNSFVGDGNSKRLEDVIINNLRGM